MCLFQIPGHRKTVLSATCVPPLIPYASPNHKHGRFCVSIPFQICHPKQKPKGKCLTLFISMMEPQILCTTLNISLPSQSCWRRRCHPPLLQLKCLLVSGSTLPPCLHITRPLNHKQLIISVSCPAAHMYASQTPHLPAKPAAPDLPRTSQS